MHNNLVTMMTCLSCATAAILLTVLYFVLGTSNHDCLKNLADPTPPCVVVQADAEVEDIANRFNVYYGKGMSVHYLHGTDNGDMVACFVKGYHDELKRFNK